MGYIYKIVSDKTDKIYVGQTQNPIKYRWEHHLYKANNPDKEETDYPLYRAMRKYGISTFQIQIIEKVSDYDLNEREMFWIKELNTFVPNGYNCTLGGAGCPKFDHEKILNYFLTEGKQNASQTAEYFDCSITTVLKILEINNLKGLGKFTPIYKINPSTGEILAQYQSEIEVIKNEHIAKTQLWCALNHQARTAGGYVWCKVDEYDTFDISQIIDKRKVAVICKENDLRFNTITAAAQWLVDNGYSLGPACNLNANISRAIKRDIKAYGFHWLKV